MSFNIALPRQRGKTTWAIRLAAKTGASLVVPTERDVVLATAKAKSLGLQIPVPITFGEFLNGAGTERGGYVFDNGEIMLSMLAGSEVVHGITMNGTGTVEAATLTASGRQVEYLDHENP